MSLQFDEIIEGVGISLPLPSFVASLKSGISDGKSSELEVAIEMHYFRLLSLEFIHRTDPRADTDFR